ncbi:unnamed protein product [Ectocarpus sp. CCAP 1310/34]|nr:unnamed protein product [Ectocarpus sp. CCAP 1310/34]
MQAVYMYLPPWAGLDVSTHATRVAGDSFVLLACTARPWRGILNDVDCRWLDRFAYDDDRRHDDTYMCQPHVYMFQSRQCSTILLNG